MAINRLKFLEGIRLKASSNTSTLEGEIRVGNVEQYDAAVDYIVGDIIGDETNLYEALLVNGPSSTVKTPSLEPLTWKSLGLDESSLIPYLEGKEQVLITRENTITLKNKTIEDVVLDGDITGTVIDTDETLAADSDTKIPSQQAVKAYVDAQILTKDEASEIAYSDVTSDLAAQNVQDALDEIDNNVDDLVTLSGVGLNSEDLGTFTGTTITDTSTIKTALQELETSLESTETDTAETDANVDDLVTLSGVAENSTDLGTFTGIAIPDNLTVKGAIQSLETQLDFNVSNIDTNVNNINVVEADVLDLNTLSGVSVNDTDLGTFTGTTITDNTTVKSALQELETAVGTPDGDKVDKVVSTDNAIVRFDGVSGDVQNSGVTISDTNQVLGAISLNMGGASFTGTGIGRTGSNFGVSVSGGEVQLGEDVFIDGNVRFTKTSDTATGSNATITEPESHIVDLTDASLVSIDGIPPISNIQGHKIILTNGTGNDITINNLTGATTDNQIVTGTGDNLLLADTASIILYYNVTDNKWQIVGGSGSGGSPEITINTAEDITAGDALYITASGTAGLLDPSDDAKVEFIGVADETITSGNPITILLSGSKDGYTGLTAGEFVYADITTPGDITSTEPTASGNYKIIVGKAISATEIVINPDLGTSSVFINGDINTDATITNNQVAATDITGVLFDGAVYRAATLEYSIYRKTDDNEVAEVGQIRVVYKTVAGTWAISNDYTGDNAGVTFSITALGQVQYTSTDVTGASYESNLQITTTNIFEV